MGTFPGMAETIQRQILTRARALIANEVNWTRRALARDEAGRLCEWNEPRAVRFCALGALVRAASLLIRNEYSAHALAMEAARQLLQDSRRTGSCLPMINDNEGHAAVLALFDAALSREAQHPKSDRA
jgi:hypothetical protein